MPKENMKTWICLDASLVLRLRSGGPHQEEVDEQWQQWISEQITFIAPPLFGFEVTSVVWQHVYHKRVTLKQGRRIFRDIFEQGIRLEYPTDLHEQAWAVAHRFNLHAAYDAHYVALAERYRCEFWTIDRRLYNVLRSTWPWVHTIPDHSQ